MAAAHSAIPPRPSQARALRRMRCIEASQADCRVSARRSRRAELGPVTSAARDRGFSRPKQEPGGQRGARPPSVIRPRISTAWPARSSWMPRRSVLCSSVLKGRKLFDGALRSEAALTAPAPRPMPSTSMPAPMPNSAMVSFGGQRSGSTISGAGAALADWPCSRRSATRSRSGAAPARSRRRSAPPTCGTCWKRSSAS